MTPTRDDTGGTPSAPAPPLPYARWAGLVALLLAEALAVGVRFEGLDGTRAGRPWWEAWLAEAHVLPNLFVLSGAATLLFGGLSLCDEYLRLSRGPRKTGPSWPYLLGHLTAFAGLYRLTALVWEGGIDSSERQEYWVLGWLATALFATAFWLAAAFPPAYWRPIVRRSRGALGAGLAVGAVSWWAGRYTLELWRPLHNSTFWAVHGLLSLVFDETVSRPADSVLGTPSFTVTIHPSCSGYEGIGLVWVFLGAYLVYFRRELRFPQSLVLIPLGTVLIWLANAVRIALLVGVGVWVSPDVAHGGFHSQGGWLAFLAVSLGLFTAGRRFPFFRQAGPPAGAAEGPNPTAPYLAPLFAVMATAMVTGAFSSGVDLFYPLRVLATAGVLWCYRGRYTAWRWEWDPGAVAIGVVVFAVWMALEPPTTVPFVEDPTLSGVMGLPSAWATVWVIFRVVGSVVTVPIAEELAFRGYLLRRFIAADFDSVPFGRFTLWSLLASSALFGLIHGRALAGFLAGLCYAAALYRRRSLGDAVLAHATTNALIAASVLFTDRWSLWR